MNGTGTKTCFIAMPVATSKAHAEFFGDVEHWAHVLETLFAPAVEAAGFEVWRPVAKGSFLIHAEIVRQLAEADMVLCDMSEYNPNVFFELGVRTSVNKPVALVRCNDRDRIPFDVSGINTHSYDPSLKAWKHQAEVDALAQHLRDAETSCAGTNPLWRQFGMQLTATEPTSEGTKEEAMLSVMSDNIERLLEHLAQRPATGRESGGGILSCAVCQVLNTATAVAPAVTSLQGVPICRRHLQEMHQSASSPSAAAVRGLAVADSVTATS
jgi:hypothetical protein